MIHAAGKRILIVCIIPLILFLTYMFSDNSGHQVVRPSSDQLEPRIELLEESNEELKRRIRELEVQKVSDNKITPRPVDQWKWHSQQNEDLVMMTDFFWKDGLVLAGGVFLEVGALDGLQYSNTLTLERELGWSGLLIEGCPENAAKLATNRPNSKVQKFSQAICDPKKTPTRQLEFSVPCSAISGTSDHGDLFMRKAHAGEKKLVPCSPMSELIDRAGLERIDFMSVDVEGFELPLLQTIDFQKVQIRIILIEVDHNSPEELAGIRKLMNAAGFQSRGLCCGHHADEIWQNPNFVDDKSKWVPAEWSAHATAASSVWRARPCSPVPLEQIAKHKERDAQGASTNFTEYVLSFNSHLFKC